MSNLIIYPRGADTIHRFLLNAWLDGNKAYSGVTGAYIVFKRAVFGLKWTDGVANPVFDGDGEIIGWDKRPSELSEAPSGGTEIAKPTHNELLDALNRRRQVADMTFAQLDTYIENNVTDLASAKTFMKLLAKAVLAVIKIQDKG
jgi:hypothetical protein